MALKKFLLMKSTPKRSASLVVEVIRTLAWVIAGATPLLLHAQENEGLLFNSELALRTESNVLRMQDAISDNFLIFSPKIDYADSFNKHRLIVAYSGVLAAYSNNHKLNYDAHDIGARVLLTNTYPFSSEFSLGYQDMIEEPGTTNAFLLMSTNGLNKFNQAAAQAKLNIGTAESIGQVVVGLDHSQRNYANNRQDFRDVDRTKLTTTFFYRIAPDTRMLFEASAGNLGYGSNHVINDQSSQETFYLTGAEWSITAKTTGIFKIGYQSKDFDQEYFRDISGLSYTLDMIWQPKTYTTVSVGASRQTRESAQLGVGGFISNAYSVTLEHELKSRTALSVSYSRAFNEISTVQNRTDQLNNLTLGLNHQLNAWLYLGVDYRHWERNSIYAPLDFGSNSFGLSFSTRFQ